MSRLILVRHAQARPFEQDSDRLSDHGLLQARKLAAWLAKPDVAISGSMERHRQTIAPIAVEYAEDTRWNEYDAIGVQTHLAPMLAARDATFAAAWRAFAADRSNRTFQPMFERLMQAYIAGEVVSAEVEPWSAFARRVRDALREIVAAPGSGRAVLVVTSGGPIALAAQTVLGAPAAKAIELNWRIRNTSVTEFLFSKGRISLDSFNATPHLAPDEVTFR